MTTAAQLIPLTSTLSVHIDPRRCNLDRLADVDLELGRRVRDALVAENLAGLLPDPSPPAPIAARTCSGIAVAARATSARRLAEIRATWATWARGATSGEAAT
jgi:hypothetical protein